MNEYDKFLQAVGVNKENYLMDIEAKCKGGGTMKRGSSRYIIVDSQENQITCVKLTEYGMKKFIQTYIYGKYAENMGWQVKDIFTTKTTQIREWVQE